MNTSMLRSMTVLELPPLHKRIWPSAAGATFPERIANPESMSKPNGPRCSQICCKALVGGMLRSEWFCADHLVSSADFVPV